MRELLSLMKIESETYYMDDAPIVSDREYDAQFDELQQLERETGIIFASSPTQKVSVGFWTASKRLSTASLCFGRQD